MCQRGIKLGFLSAIKLLRQVFLILPCVALYIIDHFIRIKANRLRYLTTTMPLKLDQNQAIERYQIVTIFPVTL